jgi:hypothetical protein
MLIKKFTVFTVLILILALVISCGDDDTNPLSPDDENNVIWPDAEKITTAISAETSDVRRASLSFVTDENLNLLAGKSTGYEARCIVRFNLQGLPKNVVSTDNAFLKIPLVYENEPSEVTFNIALLTKSIDKNQITWQEKSSDSDWDTPGGDFDDSTMVSFNIKELDYYLGTELVIVDILPLYQRWIDKDIKNYGLIIYPSESSTDGIKGFTRNAFKLTVRYTTEDVAPETEVPLIEVIDVDQSINKEVYIIDRPVIPDTGNSVVSFGGFLGAEDITFWRMEVPEVTLNSTVNQAILKLKRIGNESPEQDSINDNLLVSVFRVREDWREEDITSEINVSIKDEDTEVSLADSEGIDLNISELIRRWRKNPDENYGLAIRIEEDRDIQRSSHLFGGPGAEEQYKPRLEIIYTPAPEVQE